MNRIMPEALRPYRHILTYQELQAARQMISHMGYSLARALNAVGRLDVLSEEIAGSPAEPRVMAGDGVANGVRGVSSSLAAHSGDIPTPAGTPGDLPVELGAQAPLAPPFWLAKLRRAQVTHAG
ncbi:hypothetical protein ACRARG_12655 [Pseudooceanicola sp. C21-150M6]|uniref:hypothetical protein n=1 Tax=Pseudooceanicola sp. C21-150M6 TaxID=3434355 RepID=UPI003D7FCA9E